MPTTREIEVHFSALTGRETLLFRSMTATEGLSQLFEYRLEVLSESHTIDLDKVLGQEMSVSVEEPAGTQRFYHGYVASFSYGGSEGEYAIYHAILRPHLWKLTRTAECRIFQKKTVPVIVVDELIKKKHALVHVEPHFGHQNRGAYLPWDFCVQYRETDFNFISRLLEYEGIHYFFKHEVDKHILVLTDSLTGHAEVPGYAEVPFRRAGNEDRIDEGIWSWHATRTVLPGTHATTDFDFTTPAVDLYRVSPSEVERKHEKGMKPDYEIYDQPEPIVQQTGYVAGRVEEYARMRIEELHAQYEVVTAETNARGLSAGALFKVTDGPREEMAKTQYLIIESDAFLEMDVYRSGGGEGEATYKCNIRAINSKNHFRPARVAHKPLIEGPQSAIVVGTGDKVDTDKYGRVKVQFHWDRDGKSNEDSSCWVRVSQNSAGANWGSLFLPHIGQEVLVSFMEGDPDRPVIIGRVYNANNMPPVNLPKNKMKSIIRDHFGNEIVMDGTPGDEHMAFHSPSHHSVLQIGKSLRSFSHSKSASYTYDTESYNFGKKVSYTKGTSFSVERGAWIGIKGGAGASLTVGSELAVSGGTKLSLTVGGAITISASWSCAWGYARELKFTKGSYKRSSSSDVLLDSQKTIFITGGKNDKTLLEANDDHLCLTFDDDSEGAKRAKAMAAADLKVMGYTAGATAAIAAMSALSIYEYNRDISERGPVKDVDAKTEAIEMDYEKISGIGADDAVAGAAVAFGGAVGLAGFPGQGLDNPKHSSPCSKLVLQKDFMRLFAGKDEDSDIHLSKDLGILLKSNKPIKIEAEDDVVQITAKKELTLKSDDAVNVDAPFKHRNMTIAK